MLEMSAMTPAGGLEAQVSYNIAVAAGGPLVVANDRAFDAAHFRSFVPFHGGMLRLTGDLTTTRHLSLQRPASCCGVCRA